MYFPREMNVAFDIETRGPNFFEHGILSIGVCALYPDGTVFLKERVSQSPYDFGKGMQRYDQKTLLEFWSNLNVEREQFERESVPAEEVARTVNGWIHQIEANGPYKIISDYKDFDLAWINNLLEYFGYTSLRFQRNGSYHFTVETDSWQAALQTLRSKEKTCPAWISDSITRQLYDLPSGSILADHYPENDAHAIAFLFSQLLNLG